MLEHRSLGPRDDEAPASPDALERRVTVLLLFSVAVSCAFRITAVLAAAGAALALTNVRTPLYNRLPLWWPFWVGVAVLALALCYLDRVAGRRLRRAQDELQRRRGGR